MSEDKIIKLEYQNKVLRDHIREVQNRFENKIAELSIISEIGMTLLHVNNFSKVCEIIVDVTIKNTVAQNCSIMLMDHEKDQLFLVAATDPAKNNYVLEASNVFSKEGVRYNFRPGVGAAGMAISEKKAVLIRDTKKPSCFSVKNDSHIKIGSLISVPLLIGNLPFGVLNLSHENTNVFGQNDVNLFNILANFVGLSLYCAISYEKLKYSEEKHRALSENSNDGISIIQDKEIVYANPKFQEMTAYTIEELQKIPFQNIICAPNNDVEANYILSKLNDKSTHAQFEARIFRKDQSAFDAEISSSLIFYNGKKSFIISVRDLTDRKEIEKRLQQARNMEAIGNLAGGVAHELNNILSGVVSYPDLLLMDIPRDSPIRKSILFIQESGQKAADVVQDLLILSRRGFSGIKEVNVNHIITETLQNNEYQRLKIYYPEVHIKTDYEPKLSLISGSPANISKTVKNLITNAAESMPDGGIIFLSTQNRYVEKEIKGYEHVKPGKYVVLTVSDTGTGFHQGHLEKLFEPFYVKKVIGRRGTGLGMAVVWGTVKDHNGYIDIKSTEGKGTSFSLYFPEIRKDKSFNTYSLPFMDYSGEGETILIIDDVEEQRQIASEMLKKLGYSAMSVSSGERAVEYLKYNSADMLLLDMVMDPGIDGLETYKRILEINPGQKAIIASGFSETDRIKEAQRLGAGPFLMKPYSLEKIGTALKSVLNK